MKLYNINKGENATQNRKRVGRGSSSGTGKTSGRGQKGQNARSGGRVRPGFEGGQTPLFRRLPKRGFTNARFKKEYAIINIDQLNSFKEGAQVTPEILKDMGLIKNQKDGLKILGQGKLEKKLNIKAHKYSKQAKEQIEKLGGKAEVI